MPTPSEIIDTPGDNSDDSNDVNAPTPVIDLLDASVPAGNAIHANALKTTLKVGDVLGAKYEWTFGDPSGKYNKLTGFNAAHVYDTPGTYTLTLKITNEAGKVSLATRQITVAADILPVVEISLLRSLPLFAGLGAPELEALARRLVPVTIAAGHEVVKQGEPGDRVYVVADGELEVVPRRDIGVSGI